MEDKVGNKLYNNCIFIGYDYMKFKQYVENHIFIYFSYLLSNAYYIKC